AGVAGNVEEAAGHLEAGAVRGVADDVELAAPHAGADVASHGALHVELAGGHAGADGVDHREVAGHTYAARHPTPHVEHIAYRHGLRAVPEREARDRVRVE